MDPLVGFYNDKTTNRAVKEYFIHQIREKAADEALKGNDTVPFARAKRIIDDIWDQLDKDYRRDDEKPASALPDMV